MLFSTPLPYDLQRFTGDPSNLKGNLQAYVSGFGSNPRDVFERYEFDVQLERLKKADLWHLQNERRNHEG